MEWLYYTLGIITGVLIGTIMFLRYLTQKLEVEV